MKLCTMLLFLVGATGAFSWLHSIADLHAVLIAAGASTLVNTMGRSQASHPVWRFISWTACGGNALVYLLWFYIAATFGSVLYWAVTPWVIWLLPPLGFLSLMCGLFRTRFHIPLALPLGLWIFACIFAWGREDGRVRCDDYLQLKQESIVQVVVPTHSRITQCTAKSSFWVPRYPRRVWDYPDGQRILFTTQEGIFGPQPSDPQLPNELSGSICESPIDGSRPPRCLGLGKAEGIVESEQHDRLFIAAWGSIAPGKRGVVYAIPRTGPLELQNEAQLDDPSVELFFDPVGDQVGAFFDNATNMQLLRASDLSITSSPVAAPFDPGDVYYDADRREGLLCFSPNLLRTFNGGSAALVAFRGNPFSARALASSADYPWMWLSLVWGCQFDPDARKAWAAVTSLGLLLTVDYDTGKLLKSHFVGFGLRSMVLDSKRRRLYVANFLRGDVLALDLDTGAEIERWFAGRFVRGLRLSRDQKSLLVGSNLGVLRIPLEKGSP